MDDPSENRPVSRSDRMKLAVGSFLVKNLQKELNNAKSEHLRLIQDFNIPVHKYNQLQTDEQKHEFLICHVAQYMRALIHTLEQLQQARHTNDQLRIGEINKRFQNDRGLYAWLQVMTPHTALHKKLRKALIEKFQAEDIDPYKKENKIPLGFLGEIDKKSKQVLIDSTLALRSGAALSSAIEHTFNHFVTSC